MVVPRPCLVYSWRRHCSRLTERLLQRANWTISPFVALSSSDARNVSITDRWEGTAGQYRPLVGFNLAPHLSPALHPTGKRC